MNAAGPASPGGNGALTGRIDAVPAEVLRAEILEPQFAQELATLLPWYVAVELVLLLEYRRMGLVGDGPARALAARLSAITPERLTADADASFSDIAFAIERHVQAGPVTPPPTWHVDRSRNDLQACAQLLYARDALVHLVDALVDVGDEAARLAGTGARVPMPGYTHLQSAQVVTPGFYLAALVEETLRALRQLRATHDAVNQCPLGAGAMAGQELGWDVHRMSALLAFDRPVPHALVAVASRGWALRVAGDLSAYGVVLGRFATDLMAWTSGAYGFFDLPDELAGISSAMPQKRNFPVLERIRGRSAHLTGLYVDLALALRGTPYANMVEVSKEAGVHVPTLLATTASLLRLTTTVLRHLSFRPDRMRAACAGQYLGGFRLANLLTLRAGVPWREAQVLAGRYIAAAVAEGADQDVTDGGRLARLADGWPLDDPDALLVEAFDLDAGLAAKRSPGSASPSEVEALLNAQRTELAGHRAWAAERTAAVASAMTHLRSELSMVSNESGDADAV